jgi:hypothetical protein
MEDIFSVHQAMQLPSISSISLAPNYTITHAPSRMKIFPVTAENSTNRAVHVAASYKSDVYITDLKGYETTNTMIPFSPWAYGTVTNIEYLSGDTIDRTLVITVENLDSTMYPISGNDSDLQRIVNTAYWGDEAISFSTVVKVSSTVFKFSNILRGIQDKITTHTIGEDFWVSSYSGNQQPKIPITTITPTIKVFAENQYSKSPEISQDYTYTFSVETPYKVNGISVIPGVGKATLQFTPCVRLAGANYRNCDTITAGEDEGKVEGVFNIYQDDTLVGTITPRSYETYITYDVTSSGNYYVETQLGVFKSDKVLAVVSSTDIQ